MDVTRQRLARTAAGLSASAAVTASALAMAAPAQAGDTGVPELEQIKHCESRGDYAAENGGTSASGAYQFLDSTWQVIAGDSGYSHAADAPESVQDAAAVKLYEQEGTTPWAASQGCWGGGSAPTTSEQPTDDTATPSAEEDEPQLSMRRIAF
ncbi:transglycosylase family protein [Kytococcus sp. Marseille-QA3725]